MDTAGHRRAPDTSSGKRQVNRYQALAHGIHRHAHIAMMGLSTGKAFIKSTLSNFLYSASKNIAALYWLLLARCYLGSASIALGIRSATAIGSKR